MRIAFFWFLWIASIVHLTAQGKDDPTSHLSRAEAFLASQSFDSSAFHFTKAAELFSDESKPDATLGAITKAGQCFIRLRRIQEGITVLTSYEEHAGSVDSLHQTREDFYDMLSRLHYYAGDAFSSLRYHEKVVKINEDRGDVSPEKQIDLVRVMGVLLGNAGQLKRAIDYYRRYADLVAKSHGETHLFMSDAFNYLGVMYRHLGEYDMALDYYLKCIEIAEGYTAEERSAIAPRFRSVAPVYNNVGTVYHHRGDHKNALAYTLKALNLYEADKSANKVSLASIFSSLGTTYTNLNQHEQALVYKRKALEIFVAEYGEKHGRVGTELKNIGDSYFKLQKFETAETYFRRSLEMNLAVHGQFHANTSEAYAKLASTEEVKGNIEQSLTHIQKSIQCIVSDFISDNIFENPEPGALCNVRIHLIDKLSIKGDLFTKLYDARNDVNLLRAAHDTYSLAIDFSEIVRNDLLDIRSKAYLAENSKALFEKSIRTALILHELNNEAKYLDYAFAIMEKNKSRVLLESLQSSKVKSSEPLDEQLFNAENGLQSQIAFYEEQILDEQTKELQDSARISQLKKGLFETRRELESFKRMLENEHPRYFAAKYRRNDITIASIQKALKKDDLLIEYFAGNDAVYIFYATKTASGILIENSDRLKDTERLLDAVRGRRLSEYDTPAYSLYRKLLGAVLANTGHKERVILIPDGVIAYLPFELLLTAPGDKKKTKEYDYAIRKHNFSYQLSAALMMTRFSDESKLESTHFAGFAPHFAGEVVASRGLPGNIPFARREVAEISATFPGNIYVGADATESNFRKHAGSAALLHLATHASVEDNASFSRLYFADEDNEHDGLLHAYEIFNLHLNAKLVTLSACNTGAGSFKEGEGVMSLSRAFAYAGCSSIVTSLWPSQDQTTADIMADFYKHLAAGLTKDEALRQAKLDFLSHADNIKSDPFYWAAFILVGDPEPVNTGSASRAALWSTSGVILMALLAFGIMRWRRRRPDLSNAH